MSGKPVCVETFAGAGGMALGLKRAGFDIRFAFDLDPWAVETYRKNIGGHAEVLDAREVDGKALLGRIGLTEVDLLSGGPPCQGFSKQKRGAHAEADERNNLVKEYARLVVEIRPRAFLFENVQIFGQKRGRELIEHIQGALKEYRIHQMFVNSSEFGLAQRRDRFVIIGVRQDVSSATPCLPKSSRIVTVRDAIGDLPPPPDDFTEHPKFANHIKCRITKENERRFSYVPQGGGWRDIPAHLRLNCHKDVDPTKGGWPDVYGRLRWEGQCPTITAGFDSFTRGRYGHPEQHRSLTLREGARLQGFPDAFRFYGTRHDVRLQIGNAVPPPLAQAAGRAILAILKKVPGKGSLRDGQELIAAE